MEKYKKILKKIIFIFFILPIYFFSTILANYLQHYEYTFKDTNGIKEYNIFSNGRYGYINLENDMYIEGQTGDFKIKEVYENNDYFIGCDFNYNYETDKIGKKYYIVVDKNKSTMKIFSEEEFKEKFKNISNQEFINIYSFFKKRGTKFASYK